MSEAIFPCLVNAEDVVDGVGHLEDVGMVVHHAMDDVDLFQRALIAVPSSAVFT